MIRFLLLASFAVALYGQSVAGQTTTGSPAQSASATASFKKVPKLVMTLNCPGVPQDSTGNYLVIAGTSVSCTFTLNQAATGTSGAAVAATSADTTQFTVPASVTIPAGALVSAAFSVTATP